MLSGKHCVVRPMNSLFLILVLSPPWNRVSKTVRYHQTTMISSMTLWQDGSKVIWELTRMEMGNDLLEQNRKASWGQTGQRDFSVDWPVYPMMIVLRRLDQLWSPATTSPTQTQECRPLLSGCTSSSVAVTRYMVHLRRKQIVILLSTGNCSFQTTANMSCCRWLFVANVDRSITLSGRFETANRG